MALSGNRNDFSDFSGCFSDWCGRKVEIIDAVPQEKLPVRAARHLCALPLPPFHADDGSLTGLSPVRTGTAVRVVQEKHFQSGKNGFTPKKSTLA